MAPVYNFEIQQSGSLDIPIQFVDLVTKNPIPLTTKVFKSYAKASYTAPSASFTLTVNVVSPSNAEFHLQLAPSQSAVIPAGLYHYDVMMTDTLDATFAKRIMEGVITVTPGVTL